jgi:hypothetical protein
MPVGTSCAVTCSQSERNHWFRDSWHTVRHFHQFFTANHKPDQREGQKRHDVATGLCVFVSETVIVLLKLLPATAACDAQSIIVRRTCVPTRLAVDEF